MCGAHTASQPCGYHGEQVPWKSENLRQFGTGFGHQIKHGEWSIPEDSKLGQSMENSMGQTLFA
jgi:hypothetical protein